MTHEDPFSPLNHETSKPKAQIIIQITSIERDTLVWRIMPRNLPLLQIVIQIDLVGNRALKEERNKAMTADLR